MFKYYNNKVKNQLNWKDKGKKNEKNREYDTILVNFILKVTLFAKVP
jgi:hypothetical protein